VKNLREKERKNEREQNACPKASGPKRKVVDLFPQLVYPVHLDTLNPDWTKLHGWSRSHQGDGGGKIIILLILNKTFLKSGVSWKAFSCKKGGD
jgi:hypothetical protein